MRVDDGLYVVGCLERRVTFHSQQIRALNLIYSLLDTGIVKKGDAILVVGGGLAGLTAAAGAARLGLCATLLEKEAELFHLQRGNTKRWVHPHIYDWPEPDSTKVEASVPLLRWKAAPAGEVVRHILAAFEALPERQQIHVHLNAKLTQLGTGAERHVFWNAKGNHDKRFSAVILTVGFGLERKVEGVDFLSYWDDDRLDRLPRDGERRTLISGIGDGGLIDTLRAHVSDFDHGTMIDDLVGYPALQPVKDRLLVIEEEARRQEDRQTDSSNAYLFDAYKQLSQEHAEVLSKTVDAKLQARLRERVTVVLNGREPTPFSLKASILSRFLISRLYFRFGLQYEPGELMYTRTSSGYEVRFKLGGPEPFHRVICRHGPIGALEQFPEVWKGSVGKLRALAELDQTRRPIYGNAFDRAQSGGGGGGDAGASLNVQPEPPPGSSKDLGAEPHFRQAVVNRFERLAIRMPSFAQVELPLEDIYVDLKVVTEIPEAADTFGPEERRLYSELDSTNDADRLEKLRQLDDLKYRRWRRPEGVSASLLQPILDYVTRASRPVVILGDPGSGKSTFLHLMALRAARDGRLTPQDTVSPQGPWIPIFVPLAAYDEHLQTKENADLQLEDFLAVAWSPWRGNMDLRTLFTEALTSGRALVLLDGLDEVLTRTRRDHVNGQVRALVSTWGSRGNRFVVTSRFVGYREAPLSGDVDVVAVVDFGMKDIERFLTRWYEATERDRGAKRQKALFEQIEQAPRLRHLAANPLMLSMLAMLSSRRPEGERLPERRVELYREFTEMMLEFRPDTRSEGARREPIPRTDATTLRAYLADLALWLQRNRPSNTATREDVSKELARSQLKYEAPDRSRHTPGDILRAEREAKRLLEEMRKVAGLVGERGHDAYGFLHLTYQEFFAAGALAGMTSDERWKVLGPNLHSPRWREVILLCAGYLDASQSDDLVGRVLDAGSEYEELLHRDALMASTMVAEDTLVSPGMRGRVHDVLVELVSDDIPTVRSRALGGIVALARLGEEKSIDFLAASLEHASEQPKHPFDHLHSAVAAILPQSSCKRLLDIVLRQLEEHWEDRARAPHAVHALQLVARSDDGVRARLIGFMLRDEPSGAQMNIMGTMSMLIVTHTDVEEAFWELARTYRFHQPALLHLATYYSSVPNLRRLLEAYWPSATDGMVRSALMQAVGKLAHEDSKWLATLIGCSTDRDPNVRRNAITKLGAFAATVPEARQALLASLANDDADFHIIEAAAFALLPLARESIEVKGAMLSTLSVKLPDARWGALSALEGDALVAEVRSVLARRSPIFDPIGRKASARSPVLAKGQAIDARLVSEGLDDVGGGSRVHGIDAIASLVPEDDVVRREVESSLDDPDPTVRAAALRALAPEIHRDADLRTRALRRLDDESPIVCHAAIRALAGSVESDDMVRAHMLRIATLPDTTARSAVEALAPVARHPEVRGALRQLFDRRKWTVFDRKLAGLAAARVLSVLVPEDTDVLEQFRRLSMDLVERLIDPDDVWAVQEILEDVVERDVVIARVLLAQQPRTPSVLMLLVRHAAALNLDIEPLLDSAANDVHSLFDAVVRGALPWYRSRPSVRAYILRSFEHVALPEGVLELLVPLISWDNELRAACIRRATARAENGGNDIGVLSHLLPYVKACSDVEAAFRDLLERAATDHLGYLCRMLAAAGLSYIAERDPDLQARLLPWLGARISDSRADKAREVMARNLAKLLSPDNVWLRSRAMDMLESVAWQDRQGAAWMLLHASGEKSPELLGKLRGLLHDRREEESWSDRLRVAGVVLNHKEPALSRHAIAVAREALGYGNEPWCGDLGIEVRKQAASVLGRIEATHRDPALIAQIREALRQEASGDVRNALYDALLQLVAAPDPQEPQ